MLLIVPVNYYPLLLRQMNYGNIKAKKFLIIHIIIPLVLGAILYLFRPEQGNLLPTLFPWYPKALWEKILLYSGPDFCWAYSLSCALYLWASYNKFDLRKTAVFIFTIVLLSELVQLGSQKFTFDLWDLGATIVAFALSSLTVNSLHEKV